jgi:hypothetical protein
VTWALQRHPDPDPAAKQDRRRGHPRPHRQEHARRGTRAWLSVRDAMPPSTRSPG